MSSFDTTSDPSGFTSLQTSFVRYLSLIGAGLSILSLLYFYWSNLIRSKQQLTFPLQLVCHLFFADFIYAIANIMSYFSTSGSRLCDAEGFLRTYSLWSTVLWAFVIGFASYKKHICNDETIHTKYGRFITIACGIPVIMSTIPLFHLPFNSLPFYYDRTGLDCWIKSEKLALVHALYFFIWAWILVVLTTILYACLYWHLKGLNESQEYRGILIYPFILYVALIPTTLNSLLPPQETFPAAIISCLFMRSLGFWNCLIYGYQRIMAAMPNKIKEEPQSVSSSFIPVDISREMGQNFPEGRVIHDTPFL